MIRRLFYISVYLTKTDINSKIDLFAALLSMDTIYFWIPKKRKDYLVILMLPLLWLLLAILILFYDLNM